MPNADALLSPQEMHEADRMAIEGGVRSFKLNADDPHRNRLSHPRPIRK